MLRESNQWTSYWRNSYRVYIGGSTPRGNGACWVGVQTGLRNATSMRAAVLTGAGAIDGSPQFLGFAFPRLKFGMMNGINSQGFITPCLRWAPTSDRRG